VIRSVDHRDIFLKGKTVALRLLTKSDVVDSDWYGWFNDAEVCQTLQKHYFPNTVDAQLKFWEQHVAEPTTKLQLGICKSDDATLAGIVSLNEIDYINSKAEFSIIIARREMRDVTTFIESSRLMFVHAFDTLNLNRIYGGSVSRELVQLMCRTLGCKDEGVSRSDVFKNGEYLDVYRYGVLKNEFRAGK
jgi:[ribosomal protein S5]-alanine N-acetyltransferase